MISQHLEAFERIACERDEAFHIFDVSRLDGRAAVGPEGDEEIQPLHRAERVVAGVAAGAFAGAGLVNRLGGFEQQRVVGNIDGARTVRLRGQHFKAAGLP